MQGSEPLDNKRNFGPLVIVTQVLAFLKLRIFELNINNGLRLGVFVEDDPGELLDLIRECKGGFHVFLLVLA
jgi:hypothetical protein